MGRRIGIIIAVVVVLGVAFYLLTARDREVHKPGVVQPAVVP